MSSWPHAGLYGPESFTSPDGRPAAGAAVALLDHTGGSPVPLFDGPTRANTVPNPTTMDSLGNLALWADPGTYSLRVQIVGFDAIEFPVTIAPDPADTTPGPWTGVTYAANWADLPSGFGPVCEVRIVAGEVKIRGTSAPADLGAPANVPGSVIFTLPPDRRPVAERQLCCTGSDFQSYFTVPVIVGTDGTVREAGGGIAAHAVAVLFDNAFSIV